MGAINDLQKQVHKTATEKGFWESLLEEYPDEVKEAFYGQKIALCHTELTEALEALREGESKERIGEEFGDCVIRILDLCEKLGVDLERCILDKKAINQKRPHKHGKRF
jgi:NTP pyrophosphatase (non-canonical NTP hydrolase)